jgi:hypothetical protein
MPTLYTNNSVSASIGSNARTQLLVGNSRRVSLIISSDSSAPFRVAFADGTGMANVWASGATSIPIVFPYRDYGPVMQYPIFIENGSGVAQVFTATEIYLLSRC